MGKMVSSRKKPIVMHSLYNSAKPHALELLRYYGIPVYDSLDVACKCIGVLAEYGNYLKKYRTKASFDLQWGHKTRAAGQRVIESVRADKRICLLEHEAKNLLGLHGAPVSLDRVARSAEEAVRIAREIDKEVALKIVSPQILHKSDAGGVKTCVCGAEDVKRAYADIIDNARRYDPQADIRGVLVSPMAEKGLEVIIGTKYDDQFGPVVMYGLGGVMVEVMKDVSFRVLPITSSDARKMVEETKSSALLNGFRGSAPFDKKALQKLLTLCSEIVESYPDIREMDLNPVIVHEQGLSIVDARIILHEK
jgi:acetyltransferase